MNQDQQLMDKQGTKYQDNSNQAIQEFNTLNYFLFLLLQLILCIGWACLISYTGFGTLLIDTTTSFAISYSIIGGFSLITLISIKVFKDSQFVYLLGALFLISNPLFIAYSILGLILNYSTTIYYYQQPEANMWFIYITLGTLLLSFLNIPNRFRQFRWLCIIIIPLIFSIIAKYTYNFYDMSFSIWIGIFGVICLLLSEQQQEDNEFLVALDSFGFVFLMVIKVFQFLWNSFFSDTTSSSVLQLQDIDKAKFITYSYLIACISFLLIPQFAYILSFTHIFCTFQIFNPNQIKYEYYIFIVNSGLWIFLGLNYFFHLILFLTNRILTIGYKSIIAYIYLSIHLIFIAGIYQTTTNKILCYIIDQIGNKNQYVNPYFKPFWFCYYLIIMVQQLMFLITAILVACNRKFCLNTLNHGLLILSLIVFGNSAFEIDYANQDFYFVILLIFVMNYLLIYLGQQLLKEDSYFLYFNDDEYLISGALLSEPAALYIYQSIYIHFRYIFAK